MDRTQFIGSSDIAAVLGLNPYRTAYEVWLEKTGRLTEPPAPTLAQQCGIALEPVILEWAAPKIGPYRPGPHEYRIEGTPIIDHPDAVTESGCPVEVKTAGIVGPITGTWGAPQTDNIPTAYLAQAHVHLIATGGEQCWVPTLLGGYAPRMYIVQRDVELGQTIIQKVVQWWETYVVKNVPPQVTAPLPEGIWRRVRRTPDKIVSVPAELVQAWQAVKQQRKEQEEKERLLHDQLVAALQDAEAGQTEDGHMVTFFANSRGARTLRIRNAKETANVISS